LLFSFTVPGTHSISGEFIATKSQNQVIEADIKLEREEHFKFHREVEEMQVCSPCPFRSLGRSLALRCASCSPSLGWRARCWTKWSRASAAVMKLY
jgi:hypothetical protein